MGASHAARVQPEVVGACHTKRQLVVVAGATSNEDSAAVSDEDPIRLANVPRALAPSSFAHGHAELREQRFLRRLVETVEAFEGVIERS